MLERVLVSAVPSLGLRGQVAAHGPLGLGREGDSVVAVDSGQRIEGVAHQVRVAHVEELVGRRHTAGANGFCTVEELPARLAGEPAEHLLRVDRIRAHPGRREQDARHRGKHLQGVPVRLHDARVRVDREQRRQCRQVRGRLQDPALARTATLEELEHLLVERVRGLEIGPDEPGGIRGNQVAAGQLVAAELVRHELHALDGNARAEFVHAVVFGHDVAPEPDVLLGALDARVRGVARRLGRRNRVAHLPGQGHPVGRVLPEQLVKDRRAGAGQPGDEDGRLDAFVRDLGIALHGVGDAQTVLEPVQEV